MMLHSEPETWHVAAHSRVLRIGIASAHRTTSHLGFAAVNS